LVPTSVVALQDYKKKNSHALKVKSATAVSMLNAISLAAPTPAVVFLDTQEMDEFVQTMMNAA